MSSAVTATADSGFDGFESPNDFGADSCIESPDDSSYDEFFSDPHGNKYLSLPRSLMPDPQVPKEYEVAAYQWLNGRLHGHNAMRRVSHISCNLQAGIIIVNLRSSLQSSIHARVVQKGELLQMPGANNYRRTNQKPSLPKQVYHKTNFKEMVEILQYGFMSPFQVTLMAVRSLTREEFPLSLVISIHKFLERECMPTLRDPARVLLEKGITVQDNYPSFDGYTASGKVIPAPPCTVVCTLHKCIKMPAWPDVCLHYTHPVLPVAHICEVTGCKAKQHYPCRRFVCHPSCLNIKAVVIPLWWLAYVSCCFPRSISMPASRLQCVPH